MAQIPTIGTNPSWYDSMYPERDVDYHLKAVSNGLLNGHFNYHKQPPYNEFVRVIKPDNFCSGTVKSREVILEKINPQNSLEERIQKAMWDWQLDSINEKKCKGIIMHFDSYYELMNNFNSGKIQLGYEDNKARFMGINIIKTTDIEKGEFLLC